LVVMKTGVVQTTRAETFDFRGPVTVADQGSNVVRVTVDGFSLIGGSTYASLYELEVGSGLVVSNPTGGRGKIDLSYQTAIVALEEQIASSSSELVFDDLADYDQYTFEVFNLVPGT